MRQRRGRSVWQLENAVAECQGKLAAGARPDARVALLGVASNQAMEGVLGEVLEQVGRPDAERRIALIPLSPALAGLADGDATLTDNLRVAFSVTVAGLPTGRHSHWAVAP